MAKFNRTKLTIGDRVRVSADGVVSEATIKDLDKDGTALVVPFGVKPEAKPKKGKKAEEGEPKEPKAAKQEMEAIPHASRADEGEPQWYAFHPEENMRLHGNVFHIEHIIP